MVSKPKQPAYLSKALIRLGYLFGGLNKKEIESLVSFIEDLVNEITIQEAAQIKRMKNK